MSENFTTRRNDRKLLWRPQGVIDAEQKRHDRAKARGLVAIFAALVVGGGLAFFIQHSPMFSRLADMQAFLAYAVFVVPVVASFITVFRIPPPPYEMLLDDRRDIDRKEKEWAVILLSQVVVFAMLALENVWLWPRHPRVPDWMVAMATSLPMLCMVFLGINALYLRPGWLNPELRQVFDDELNRSFRARAQRLGYLLLLFVLLAFAVLARIRPLLAAHYLPLGLAVGVALPVLYFVYMDWQASRGA